MSMAVVVFPTPPLMSATATRIVLFSMLFSPLFTFSAAKVEAWDALFYVATFSVAEAHFFCGTSSPNQQENNTMRE